tara:strand:+ start:2655 stop:5039 length:2385 start_codon:yes stop_codon:yes gene_type:complete
MKVPTYTQETTATRETGSRNLSVQASGRALAAPFLESAETFRNVSKEALRLYGNQLRTERNLIENEEALKYKRALDEAEEQAKQQKFDSHEKYEIYFDSLMDKHKKTVDADFGTENRKKLFFQRMDESQITRRANVTTDAKNQIIARRSAVFLENLAEQNSVVVDTSMSGNPVQRADAQSKLSKLYDQAEEDGLFDPVDLYKLKTANDKQNIIDSLTFRIDQASSAAEFESLKREIKSIPVGELSASTIRSLGNITQAEFNELVREQETDKQKRIAEQNRVSQKELNTLKLRVLRSPPEEIERMRQSFVKKDFTGFDFTLADQVRALEYVSSRAEKKSSALASQKASLAEDLKASVQLQDTTVEDMRPLQERAVALGDEELIQDSILSTEVVRYRNDIKGLGPSHIGTKIDSLESMEPAQIFAGSTASEPVLKLQKQRLIESMKKEQQRSFKYLNDGFPVDYIAETEEVEAIQFTEESVSKRLDLMTEVAGVYKEGSEQSIDQVNRSMQPFRASEVEFLGEYLDGNESTAKEKADALIVLKPLLDKYPQAIEKLAESKKADVYMLASQLPVRVAAGIISGLNEPKTLGQITEQSVKDAVIDQLGQTFKYISDGNVTQSTIERAVVALVRHTGSINMQDLDLEGEVENAVNAITGGIGKRGDTTFELPEIMKDSLGNEITDLDEKKELMELWFENFSVDMILAFAPDGLTEFGSDRQALETVAKKIRDEDFLPISINNNRYAFVQGSGTNMKALFEADGMTDFAVSWNENVEQILYDIIDERRSRTNRGLIEVSP